MIGTSGHASATSSGSTREMSQSTRSGGSTLSVVVSRCPGRSPSSRLRKKRSTPTSRIVATRATVATCADADNRPMGIEQRGLSEGLSLIRSGAYFEAHEELEDEWREAPSEERDFL